MSTARSIVSYNLCGHRKSHQASIFNLCCLSVISKYKNGHSFSADHGLLQLRISHKMHRESHTKMDVTVRNSAQHGAPSTEPPHNSWKSWIIGTILSIILPFWKHKWGPLLALKNEVETVIETVKDVTEIVEEVTEDIEKVAKEVGDKLPEGGNLKEAVSFVENLAKETAKDSQLIEEFTEKVEEVEKEVKSFIETVMDQASVDPKVPIKGD